MKIRGVLSYTELDLGGQSIYIFGERHTSTVPSKEECPDSMTFLDFIDMFEQQRQKLHIFVENPYCKDSLSQNPRLAHIPAKFKNGNISDLKRNYSECMWGTSSKCSLQSTKIVPSDIRNSKGESSQGLEFLLITGPLLVVHDELKLGKQPSQLPKSVYEFLRNPATFLYNLITQSSKGSILSPLYVKLQQQRLITAQMLRDALDISQQYYDKEYKQQRHAFMMSLQKDIVFNMLCSYGSMLMDIFIFMKVLELHPTAGIESVAILVGDFHAALYKQMFVDVLHATIQMQAVETHSEECLTIA